MDLEFLDPEFLDPELLDLDTAEQLADVLAATRAHLPLPAPTGPGLLLETAHRPGTPTTGLWLARDQARLVGFAVLALPRHEYTDVAILSGAVLPSHQRRGIGRALLTAVSAATERPFLRARAWAGTTGEQALPAMGFAPRMTHVVRRLDLTDGAARRESLRAEVEAAAGDYVLSRHAGPTGPDRMAEMVVLREAINDAPDSVEFEAYPPERIRAEEQSLVDRHQSQYTVIARHRHTGEPAGLTIVAVDEFSPSVAHQEDTSVLPDHRGHRLGLLLKLEMADWLRTDRPEVIATDTWNDATNHHMIAVNERLGLREIARTTAYRRTR